MKTSTSLVLMTYILLPLNCISHRIESVSVAAQSRCYNGHVGLDNCDVSVTVTDM